MKKSFCVLSPRAHGHTCLVARVIACLMTSSLHAQVLWDGGASGGGTSWNTPANWAGDALPSSGASITFNSRNAGGTLPATMSASRMTAYGTITFDNINSALPAILTINTNGSGTTAQTVTVNSGISLLNSTTSVVFNEASFGVLSIALGADVTIHTQLAGSQITMNPVISGAFRITKTGDGTLRLQTSANTFSGGISVLAGALSVSLDSRLGAVPVSATPGNLLLNGGTLLVTGGFTISSTRGIAIGPASGSGTGTVNVASAQTLTYAGIMADNPGGSGRLIKMGAGTLYMSGGGNASSYTGGVTISEGTMRIDAGTGLGAAPAAPTPGFLIIETGATLRTSNTFTLSVNRGIAIGPGSGTGAATILVDTGETLTYAGVIANNASGTGQLVKTGDGVLRFTGNSTYTGSTTITAGTLSFLQGTSMGTAPGAATPGHITVNGGTLEFENGTGSLTLATNRGIALGPTSGSGGGTISVANAAATMTYAGIIADTVGGTGSFTKSGVGTLRLQGDNTYSGGTVINSGTLMASNTSGSATGGGAVTVASTGILRGAGTITGAVTLQSGGEIRPGETTVNTLTLAATTAEAGGKLIFRLAGNGSNDRLTTGLAALTLDTAALIEVVYEGSYTGAEGHSFNLLDWGSLTSDGNLADQVTLPALTSGLAWDTSLFTSQGVISISLVPEPTRAGLIAFAAMMLFMRRQRRKT